MKIMKSLFLKSFLILLLLVVLLPSTACVTVAHFCLYVHHTDAQREWAYDRENIDPFGKALDEALAKGWTVVNMKDDWKTIYASEKK